MSSSAYIEFEEPVTLEQWEVFCKAHDIVYRPEVVGRNTFAQGAVEIQFGEHIWVEPPRRPDSRRYDFSKVEPPREAKRVSVSTYWMGDACGNVAKLAAKVWHEFGGELSAAPEIRDILAKRAAGKWTN